MISQFFADQIALPTLHIELLWCTNVFLKTYFEVNCISYFLVNISTAGKVLYCRFVSALKMLQLLKDQAQSGFVIVYWLKSSMCCDSFKMHILLSSVVLAAVTVLNLTSHTKYVDKFRISSVMYRLCRDEFLLDF